MDSKFITTMTGPDFTAWMDQAGCHTAADIVRKLGVSRNRAQEWVASAKRGETMKLKRSVALAMSAAAVRMGPWPEPREKCEEDA